MKENLVEKISNGRIVIVRTGTEQERVEGFYAPATVSLIKDPNNYSLIDAGCYGEEQIIKRALKLNGVQTHHVKSVIITHNHPDHAGTISMFKNANIIMPDSAFRVAKPNIFKLIPSDFYEKIGNRKKIIGLEGFSIANTSGHAGQDISVLYEQENGTIAIVGDLFWSEKDWNDNSEFLGLCVNPNMQRQSREYIRNLNPRVVVPGHGPAFLPKYHHG
jgi:glyoxylase-like metal-dependent hydrolase (beta-lactamase superfamily II)